MKRLQSVQLMPVSRAARHRAKSRKGNGEVIKITGSFSRGIITKAIEEPSRQELNRGLWIGSRVLYSRIGERTRYTGVGRTCDTRGAWVTIGGR